MKTNILINIFLFIILVTIFIFLFFSPDVHGFRTPNTSPNLFISPILDNSPIRTQVEIRQRPIMITPSQVKIIPEIKSKHEFNIQRLSPSGSVTASTIFNVPIEYPINLSTKIIKDRPGFIFDDSRNFDSIGEKLCCKIFEQWLYNKFGSLIKAKLHYRPDFLRNPNVENPTKRNNLELDMIYSNIAIEYNGSQHTRYVSNFHNSYDDYLKQVSNDLTKVTICKNVGIELIVIDADIDTMKIDSNGKKKYIRLNIDQRENKIKEKLIPLLEEAFEKNKY